MRCEGEGKVWEYKVTAFVHIAPRLQLQRQSQNQSQSQHYICSCHQCAYIRVCSISWLTDSRSVHSTGSTAKEHTRKQVQTHANMKGPIQV